MTDRSFIKIFLKASTSSALASALNLLTTVLVARWLGDHVYADYIVDLAVISIILIILEIIPSNYVVFKVQDDAEWIHSAATQAVASFFVISLVTVGLGVFHSPFKQYTPWIAVYAATMAIKRFLDIRLQSTGSINQFLKLEVFIAGLRLTLLFTCVRLQVDPVTSIWMSLALATAAMQLFWFLTHPEDLQPLKRCFAAASIKAIVDERAAYPGYYLGICLKRIRDNLMPLAAERFFQQKDELAAFFLAYRGLVFASGQIRILEGFVNHKPTMDAMLSQTASKKILIAALAQFLAIVASAFILYSADAGTVNVATIFCLSLITWPSTYLILARARAYSQYQSSLINASLLAHIATLTILCVILKFSGLSTGVAFACALIAAEWSGLLTLTIRSKKTDD